MIKGKAMIKGKTTMKVMLLAMATLLTGCSGVPFVPFI
jgi:starvation-inducible outer membrane lipoprotein|tara:strand:+ start:20263 stop:20376 length:114 start_codon:yes stop_codon:yes gene_type:complete